MELTTNWKQIENTYAQMNDERSYYVVIHGKYTLGADGTATINFAFQVNSSGSEGCSISGNYFNLTLNGTPKSAGPLSYYVPSKNNSTGLLGTLSFPVSYDANGQYRNKSVSWRLSGGDGSYSGGGTMSDAGTGWESAVVSLPDIDKNASASINGVSIASDGLDGNAVASVSKLSVSVTLSNVRDAYISWSGSGLNDQRINLSPTYVSSETLVGTMSSKLPANASDYTINFKLYYKNNRSSTYSSTQETTFTVRGYTLPTYGQGTYTQRCDASGTADAQGEYGMLYLDWVIASVNGANYMTADPVVKLNGTTLVNGDNCVITGSIASRYFQYIFPLNLETEGSLEITLADRIATITINQLSVPKSIMPLSLYQSATAVGTTIGQMATQDGFRVMIPFYLKADGVSTVYNIYIDSDGVLHVGGYTVQYVGGNPV